MEPKRVLIVDDDPDPVLGLGVRLQAGGFDTVTATDAISAISVAQRELPDVVILDLGLPAGDGFTVMERLSSIPALARVPVIVLSARDPAANKRRAMDAGATAYFQKPCDNEDLMEAVSRAAGTDEGAPPSAQASRKILIVDDDPDLRLGLSVRLRATGYQTAVAVDGLSAISTALKERPDLIILDLGLPAGDGFLVMEWLKGIAALAEIPLIVLSARDEAENKDRAIQAGARAYFQKPANNEALLAAIEQA